MTRTLLRQLPALRTHTPRQGLQQAIRCALERRNTDVLRLLAQRCAHADFAAALCALSTRQRDDALSLLQAPHRSAVLQRLPRVAQRQWLQR